MSSCLARIICAGQSLNGNIYPPETLKKSLHLFEQARVFIKSDEDHLRGQGRNICNLIGKLTQPFFKEDAVYASIVFFDETTSFVQFLRHALAKNMHNLFGLSISAEGITQSLANGGTIVSQLTRIFSVDFVAFPSAGGTIFSFSSHHKEPSMHSSHDTLSRHNTEQFMSETENMKLLQPHENATQPKEYTTIRTEDLIDTLLSKNIHNLPNQLRDSIKKRILTQLPPQHSETHINEAIATELQFISLVSDQGRIRSCGQTVNLIEAQEDKYRQSLHDFFNPQSKNHRHAQSIKECYQNITSGSRSSLQESLYVNNFDQMLGTAISHAMLQDYRSESRYNIWQKLATVTPVSDFRQQDRFRIGGYPDLPTVPEGSDYTTMNAPQMMKSSYSIFKKGAVESVTFEMIQNDDVGLIRQIPKKLSLAAKRTLSKFVLNLLWENPIIYDGQPLFHENHHNIMAAPLTAETISSARLAMLKQKDTTSETFMAIVPQYLWLPYSLEEQAMQLLRPYNDKDQTFVSSLGIQVIPVWYWAESQNFYFSANPEEFPSVEIGFLNGCEEPELFISDSPLSSPYFSSDRISYKIRHVYGGHVLDHKAVFACMQHN